MENIIPFTKEIKFNDKINEITSISLEQEYTASEFTVDGEFIISGEYKTHELSVNKQEFNYRLPFSVDLTNKIDKDTLNLEITDFSYDILNDDTLKANIEIKITADEVLQEENNEDVLEILDKINEEDTLETRIDNEEKNTIINTINNTDNDYITYHIHMVKEAETIESICALYNTNNELLENYNDLTDFGIGKKLIIVSQDE